MKKGFPIRQMLIFVDVLLAGLVVATLSLAAARALRDEATAPPSAALAATSEGALLREPADRATYDPIIAANLYGTPARLTGPPIARMDDADPLADAGALSDAELAALRRRLDERRRSARDRRGADAASEQTAEETDPLLPGMGADEESASRRVVDRRAAERELRSVNTAEVFSEASPQLVHDEAGNVRGITSPNIDKIPMARQLGFQQGDVLRMINGVQIDSEKTAIDAIKRFRESPTYWVTIERQGRLQTLVVNLE